jgi:hypothetical protein
MHSASTVHGAGMSAGDEFNRNPMAARLIYVNGRRPCAELVAAL